MFGESQPSVLEDGAQRETGENSRMASFMGAFAICDLVKTTMGPKGMDKILQPMGGGQVKITNDGATILQSIMIDNPAAKVLVEISKVQDNEVGDGTTTVVIIAAEILKVSPPLTTPSPPLFLFYPSPYLRRTCTHLGPSPLLLVAVRLRRAGHPQAAGDG